MFSKTDKRKTAIKQQPSKVDKISLSIIRIIIGVLVGMQIFVPIVMTYDYIYQDRMSFQRMPGDFGLKYEQVEYKTQDNLLINGWFIPSESEGKSPGILLVHGLGTNRSDILDIGKLLHDNGYSVLLFDLRGHGLSEGDKSTFGLKEVYDIDASFQVLSQQKNVDEDRLGIYAVSLGASSSILAEDKMEFVNKFNKVLVLDSPFSDINTLMEETFPYRRGFITPVAAFISKQLAEYIIGDDLFLQQPVSAIRKIEKPVFLIHGAEDRLVNKSHSILLNEQKKLGEKEIWLVPLSDHLQAHSSNTVEYEERVVSFFDKYLKDKNSNT